MLLRNPKKQMRLAQSLWVKRNSSIYILKSGYIHSSGFVLSVFNGVVINAWCKLKRLIKDEIKEHRISWNLQLLNLKFGFPPSKKYFPLCSFERDIMASEELQQIPHLFELILKLLMAIIKIASHLVLFPQLYCSASLLNKILWQEKGFKRFRTSLSLF